MKRSRWWLALVCVVGGCHGGNNNNGMGTGPALKANIGLDVAHIVGFAVGGGGASARLAPGDRFANADGGTTTTSQLYAIDDQGNLVTTTIVTDTSGDGGTTTSTMNSVPVGIVDTPQFVVFEMDRFYLDAPGDMAGGNMGGGQSLCFNVFMRKSDGALFCDFTKNFGVSHGGGPGGNGFDYDGTGDNIFAADGIRAPPRRRHRRDAAVDDHLRRDDDRPGPRSVHRQCRRGRARLLPFTERRPEAACA